MPHPHATGKMILHTCSLFFFCFPKGESGARKTRTLGVQSPTRSTGDTEKYLQPTEFAGVPWTIPQDLRAEARGLYIAASFLHAWLLLLRVTPAQKAFMNLFKSSLLSTLLLAGLTSCTVGDSPAEQSSADAGGGGNAPDAEVVAQAKWESVTTAVAGIRSELHYVSDSELYAIINDRIKKWDGTAWLDETLDAPGMSSAMHFVSSTEIYAIVGNRVDMWNGTAWAPMTDNQAGISAELHVVSATEMYAVVDGNKICKWTGTLGAGGTWADHTEVEAGIGNAIDFKSPEEIYAVIGLKVCKWTGVLAAGGAWTIIADDQAGLAPALKVVSETEMYAVVGQKVCKYDGTSWADLTDDISGLKPAFHYVSDDDITAIAEISLSKWSKP